MKRFAKIIAPLICLTLLLSAVAFGCGGTENDDPISVTALQSEITLGSSEVMGYDYVSLFKIEFNGKEVPVLSSYLDRSGLSAEAGQYEVSCSYSDHTARVKVNVTAEEVPPPEVNYTLALATESIRINADEVETYDYNALFTLKADGVKTSITDDMVTTDVKAQTGEYTYTVAVGKVSETLKITVWETPKVEIVAAYRVKEVPLNELEGFDYKSLFSLYLKGIAARVTDDMIDADVPSAPAVGSSFTVTASFEEDGFGDTASVTVKAVAEKTAAVSIKDVRTYPNGALIDLTSLFEITYGGENVPVTIDMIDGTVNYSKAGENVITLSYGGRTYTATVTVVLGVVIDYARADTITVVKDSVDKKTYSFAGDFVVTINGTRYADIENYIDTSEVDFTKVGVYTARVEIPYNTDNIPLVGDVPFDGTANAEITYVVVEADASVKITSPLVELPAGTNGYGLSDIRSNLSVSINGIQCVLTDRRDHVSGRYSVLVEMTSQLDFTDKGEQEVALKVYTSGLDSEPLSVSYKIIIGSATKVEAHDFALFAGGTVYSRNLFTITEGGEDVPVTDDMIEGKVDSFTPGIYYVTIGYEGMTATSRVVVFEQYLKGTYSTTQKLIPDNTDDDDDDYEDIGWGDGEGYSLVAREAAAPSDTLGDLVIADGSITVNGIEANSVLGIDERTITFNLGTNKHTLYYDDGIAVLDPDNSNKLGYTNYRRPMVYFSRDLWSIEQSITINYSTAHVLTSSFISYSIDTFRIKSKTSGEEKWYGMKIHLINKTSADTIYKVTWGEVEYAADFDANSAFLNQTPVSVVFGGETYTFLMSSRIVGKIAKSTSANYQYAGLRFTGTVNSLDAYLVADSNERYTYMVGNDILVNSFGASDVGNYMIYGGANYAEKTVRLNSYGDKYYSQVFSYQFNVNPDRKRFSLVKRDPYFGRYENADGSMFIFLDGYGYGCISFDTTKNAKTLFRYTASGNEIRLLFDEEVASGHGDEMSVYISPLLNLLTVKEAETVALGTNFTNRADVMTDGAIVEVKSLTVGAASDAVAKPQLLENIRVIDRDGEWDYEKKNKLENINTMRISFSTPGFYQFTVTVSVNGLKVNNYYSIQVLERRFADNPLIASYGKGAIFPNNSLELDEYGRAKVTVGATQFIGSVTEADASSFVVKAYSESGTYLCGIGRKAADGIIVFTAYGAAPFTDYFTTGTSRVIGRTGVGLEGIVLREFNVGGVKTYFVSDSATSTGDAVTVEIVSGSETLASGTVLKIKWSSGKERQVTVVTWGDTTDGLQVVQS